MKVKNDRKIVVFAGNGVLGSTEKKYMDMAYELGRELALAGYTVVNGGGPGLMDKTAKGAHEAGGDTIGICLRLKEGKHSEYLKKMEVHQRLRQRQEKLVSLGDAFLVLPGGIGTFYEAFEVITLKRKDELSKAQPLVFISKYFECFERLMLTMKIEGFVGPDIEALYEIVPGPKEAVDFLNDFFRQKII